MYNEEIKLYGAGVGNSVAIGKAFVLLPSENFVVPAYNIYEHEIEIECKRFERAILESKEQIKAIQINCEGSVSDIFDAHIAMLDDEVIQKEVYDALNQELKNIDFVYNKIMQGYFETLSAVEDTMLAERANDIMDIKMRVLRNLAISNPGVGIPKQSIVIASNITPSDVLYFRHVGVLGFIVESGGITSHAAILAKSFDMPAVFAVADVVSSVKNNDRVVIDAQKNMVVLNPSEDNYSKYELIQKRREADSLALLLANKEAAITRDGLEVKLLANVDIQEEIESVIKYEAQGVGLYRTEFLYLQKDNSVNTPPSEAEHISAYKNILSKINAPVVIRTLDLGGDKISHLEDTSAHDENPFLGWRAIRFCLGNKDVFRIQLRAILLASVFGNASIMFPMICTVEELVEAKSLLEDVKAELTAEGEKFSDNIKVGVLVETPSAAMIAHELAGLVDFFSIGSNDLIQYTLACDRTNERVRYLYNPLDISVLRLIKRILDAARDNNIPASLCGQMGGDPYYTPVLLGLGLRNFSMSPPSIPRVKHVIRSVSLVACEKLASDMLCSRSNTEAKTIFDNFIKD